MHVTDYLRELIPGMSAKTSDGAAELEELINNILEDDSLGTLEKRGEKAWEALENAVKNGETRRPEHLTWFVLDRVNKEKYRDRRGNPGALTAATRISDGETRDAMVRTTVEGMAETYSQDMNPKEIGLSALLRGVEFAEILEEEDIAATLREPAVHHLLEEDVGTYHAQKKDVKEQLIYFTPKTGDRRLVSEAYDKLCGTLSDEEKERFFANICEEEFSVHELVKTFMEEADETSHTYRSHNLLSDAATLYQVAAEHSDDPVKRDQYLEEALHIYTERLEHYDKSADVWGVLGEEERADTHRRMAENGLGASS